MVKLLNRLYYILPNYNQSSERHPSSPNREDIMSHPAQSSQAPSKKDATKVVMPFAKYGGREFLEDNKDNDSVLCVISNTGSGKSTQLAEFYADLGRVAIMLIPGRAATIALYKFMSSMTDREDLYAFSIGGKESDGHAKAPMRMCTAGWALAKLHDMSFKWDTFILDEAHTPSADYYLLRKIAKKKLKDGEKFKLILCSATISADMFSSDFPNMKTFDLDKKAHYVNPIKYHDKDLIGDHEKDVLEICKVVLKIQEDCPDGDKIVFCEGERVVVDIASLLESRLDEKIRICTLYGSMEPSDIQETLNTKYDGVTIYVVTNMVESSITIPRVTHVICSGMQKTMYIDGSGRKSLRQEYCSQSSLLQQRGRGMRTVVLGSDGKQIIGFTYMMLTEEKWKLLKLSAPREVDTNALHEPIMELLGLGYSPEELMDDILPRRIAQDKAYLLRFGLLEYMNKTMEQELTDLLGVFVSDKSEFFCMAHIGKIFRTLGLHENFGKLYDSSPQQQFATYEEILAILTSARADKKEADRVKAEKIEYLLIYNNDGAFIKQELAKLLGGDRGIMTRCEGLYKLLEYRNEINRCEIICNYSGAVEAKNKMIREISEVLTFCEPDRSLLSASVQELLSFRTDLPIVTGLGKAVTSIATDIPGGRALYNTAKEVIANGYPDIVFYAAFMEARRALTNGPFHYPKRDRGMTSEAWKSFRMEFTEDHFMQYFGKDDIDTSLTVYRIYMEHHGIQNKPLAIHEKYKIDHTWLHEVHFSSRFFETMRRTIDMLLRNLRQLGLRFPMYDTNRPYDEIATVLWPVLSSYTGIFTQHNEMQRNGSIRNIFKQTAAVATAEDRVHENATKYTMDGWHTINEDEFDLPKLLVAFETRSVTGKGNVPFYTISIVFGKPRTLIDVPKIEYAPGCAFVPGENIDEDDGQEAVKEISEYWDDETPDMHDQKLHVPHSALRSIRGASSKRGSFTPARGAFSGRGRGGFTMESLRRAMNGQVHPAEDEPDSPISKPSACNSVEETRKSYSPVSSSSKPATSSSSTPPSKTYSPTGGFGTKKVASPVKKDEKKLLVNEESTSMSEIPRSSRGGFGSAFSGRGGRGGLQTLKSVTRAAPVSYRPSAGRFAGLNNSDEDNEY
jgi:HrpA-like RNA helicase